tara:strand:- start:1725 stop:2387 length:663 start_codon:yes stop_codon:yes gene_type:complete
MPQTHLHKTLVTFGDSWPQGGELKENLGQYPYGRQLADQYGYKFLNYGAPGASNEDMVLQLIEANLENVTAIFFLTNPARSMHWPLGMSWNHASDERKHWPNDAKDFVKFIRLHFHDENRDNIRTSMAVITLQQMCKSLNIDDYYFAGWIRQTDWLPGVNTDKIYKGGNETAADWLGATDHNGEHLLGVQDNEYIRPNFAHPNHNGHALIAKKLANWLEL